MKSSTSVILPVQRLRAEGVLPEGVGSVLNVFAAIVEPVQIVPGQIVHIPTGFAFEVPDDNVLSISLTPILAVKHGLLLLGPPVLGPDFRTELVFTLANLSMDPYTFKEGLLIGSLILCNTTAPRVRLVSTLQAPRKD